MLPWVAGALALAGVAWAVVIVLGSRGVVGPVPQRRLTGGYHARVPLAPGWHLLGLRSDGTYEQTYYEPGGRQIGLAVYDLNGRQRTPRKTWTVTHDGARTIVHLRNYTSQANLTPGGIHQISSDTDVDLVVCRRWDLKLQLVRRGEKPYTMGG
jgi:hypothetical protein